MTYQDLLEELLEGEPTADQMEGYVRVLRERLGLLREEGAGQDELERMEAMIRALEEGRAISGFVEMGLRAALGGRGLKSEGVGINNTH